MRIDPPRQCLRALALIGLVAGLAACASAPPPAPPRPAAVPLRVEAAPRLNPDDQGRPLSVVLRVYELRGADPFARAPYEALLRRDAQTLGPSLVARRELVVAPGDAARVESQPLAADTTHLAVMALYRRPDPQAFRQVFAVADLPGDGVALRLEGCSVVVTRGKPLGEPAGNATARPGGCPP
jgi:type VI secretion system protein VasD